MTPDEEFDAAAQTAQQTLAQFPPNKIEQPGTISEWIAKLNPTLWGAAAGVNAAKIARDIAASLQVLIATKSLSNDSEKAEFANSILVLQSAYMDARNKALVSTSARYVITTQLRNQTATLNKAFKKVTASTAAMNQVGGLLDGLSSLISALK